MLHDSNINDIILILMILLLMLMFMLMVRAHMYTLRAYDYVYLDVYAYGLVCTGSTNAISDLVNNTCF